MKTEQEILERHAISVRSRARMELKIVNRLLADAKAAGYTVKIAEYEEDEGSTPEDVRDALFNLDEAHVMLFKDGKHFGTIFLVFGNDGYDLISDYHCKLEAFLKGCEEVADKLEAGLL